MRYEVALGDASVRVEVAPDGRFLVNDRVVAAELRERVRGQEWLVLLDGASHTVTLLTREPMRLDVDGTEVAATVVDERALRGSRGTAIGRVARVELRAPMPGLLKAVHVAEGDRIEADAPLVTLEAMKMENELRAPSAGRVARVAASAGSKIEGGAVLVVIATE